jgi:hypothetical protein
MKASIGDELPTKVVDGDHNTIPHHATAAVIPYPEGSEDIVADPQGLHTRMVWLDVLESKGQRLVAGGGFFLRDAGSKGLRT